MKTALVCAVLAALGCALIPGAGYEKAGAEEKPMVLLVEAGEESAQESFAADDMEKTDTANTDAAGECFDAQEIRLLTKAGVQELSMQEYLCGVLLSEMPSDFDAQARRAQAVAARTFTAKRQLSPKHENAAVCEDFSCCQAWTSTQALKEKLGDSFEAVWQEARQAVMDTAGEVLLYDGALIDAVYFSCSGGKTEPALAVWGTDVPYLQSVESPGEQDAPRYFSEAVFSPEEFSALLQSENENADFSGKPETWLGALTRSDGGGVLSYAIGGADFSGTDLRRIFSLRSTNFTLSYQDGAFCFDVLGFGHRVGLSQYGAQAMAELGFSYRTILQYYYRGTHVETLDTV